MRTLRMILVVTPVLILLLAGLLLSGLINLLVFLEDGLKALVEWLWNGRSLSASE